MLVIYTEGNDVCLLRMDEILTLMRAGLERILGFFQDIVLVWSEIVPRVTWQGAQDVVDVESAWRTINARCPSLYYPRWGWLYTIDSLRVIIAASLGQMGYTLMI